MECKFKTKTVLGLHFFLLLLEKGLGFYTYWKWSKIPIEMVVAILEFSNLQTSLFPFFYKQENIKSKSDNKKPTHIYMECEIMAVHFTLLTKVPSATVGSEIL